MVVLFAVLNRYSLARWIILTPVLVSVAIPCVLLVYATVTSAWNGIIVRRFIGRDDLAASDLLLEGILIVSTESSMRALLRAVRRRASSSGAKLGAECADLLRLGELIRKNEDTEGATYFSTAVQQAYLSNKEKFNRQLLRFGSKIADSLSRMVDEDRSSIHS